MLEEGIGEDRAICVTDGAITAARLHWPGTLTAGQVVEGRLLAKAAGSRRGTLHLADGQEALIDGLPSNISEGSILRASITRSALAESGRTKLAQARLTTQPVGAAPSLVETLRAEGHTVRTVHRFSTVGWDELLADAFSGEIPFSGGTLLLIPTPAMTLVDIDGTLPPAQLALAAAPAIAQSLRRLDIGGSVGIDFPTLARREDRRAVDLALERNLGDWPHEGTAMNGFGFVQLVARLKRPSILHLASRHRAAAAARALLRRGELVEGAGSVLLTCHPDVKAQLKPDWLAELARRCGRPVTIETAPSLALEAGFAQAISL